MNRQNFLAALTRKNYTVCFFDKKEEAADFLTQSIRAKTVGFGDSATLQALGLQERLSTHNEVHNPALAVDNADFMLRAGRALTAQVFLTSVNAAAETGELVNNDGTGNRVAAAVKVQQDTLGIIRPEVARCDDEYRYTRHSSRRDRNSHLFPQLRQSGLASLRHFLHACFPFGIVFWVQIPKWKWICSNQRLHFRG